MIPFNAKFYDISNNNPDLYGPFWIYTTLIFILAASGSFSKHLKGEDYEEFFSEFIGIAASLVSNNKIDIWNRFYPSIGISSTNEMFRNKCIIYRSTMYLCIFIYNLYTSSLNMYVTI